MKKKHCILINKSDFGLNSVFSLIFVCRKMRIHSMQVKCDEILYDIWMIDDDTTNILGLFEAIEEDLKILEKEAPTTLDVTAHIRGGEHVITVTSDATMMQMFNLNSNTSDVILLEVKRVSCPPLAVLQSGGDESVNNEEVEEVDGDEEVEEVEFGDEEEEEVEVGDEEFKEVDGEEVGDEDVGREISSDDDEDISDPEWKYGRDYSEEEASSDSIGDIVVSSDDEVWSDVDAEKNVRRRPARDEVEIDPMSNISEAPSHIGLDGKINLQLWQVFDDHKHFGGVILDY